MQEAVEKEFHNEIDEMVNAIYSEQIISDYAGNPLIEALPPIFTEDDVIDNISVFPPFDERERELDSNYRFHCIKRLNQYFQPFEDHLDLEQRLSVAIRQGYLHRSPLMKGDVKLIHESYRALKEKKFKKKYQAKKESNAQGFTIIGLSGIGKSTALERVFSFYPQLIQHQEYKGELLRFVQISWLKLECPYDGSLNGLGRTFFAGLDRLLGTNYLYKFGSKTADEMLQHMVHLSVIYKIGVLVIDEIQHLNSSKSRGSDLMLNFFVTLVNTIGIPVVLVGTNKALSVLQVEFRQARRGSGQGDMVWEQMPKNDNWHLFLEGMWEYQWTQKYTELTEELSDLLYDECQGILDIAVKLFMLAQVRAISNGTEKIGKKVIKEVAGTHLKLVQPMLKALRSGIPSEIAKYEDIRPIDIEEAMETYKASMDFSKRVSIQKKLQAKARNKKEQSLIEEVIFSLLAMNFEPKEAESAIKKVIKNLGEEIEKSVAVKESVKLLIMKDGQKEETKLKRSKKKDPTSENKLGILMQEARKNKKSVYEWFVENGIIKNPLDEFLEEDEYAAMVPDAVS